MASGSMSSGSSGGYGRSSSSLGYPPSYRQAQTSPLDSTWTPTSRSTVSALTSNSSIPPTPLRPLDLGPPGYQATITLFERTADEITVYLGPWDLELASHDRRRLAWQCSYQGEVLEHFLPSSTPADTVPISLHAHHRRFEDPHDMELYLSFREPHRVRYTTAGGNVVHDAVVEVKYVFATFEGSLRFQSDVRNKELVDFFDVDVVWSDRDGRTDAFGAVRGVATGQRMKLWRDRYASCHSLSFLGRDRRFREYPIGAFEREVRGRDERHRRLRLNVLGQGSGGGSGRRGSAQESSSSAASNPPSRRVSLSSFRPRQRSVDSTNSAGVGSSAQGAAAGSHHHHHHHPEPGSSNPGLNIRYLGIQFSRTNDYTRFIEQWNISYAEDSAFNGIPFPPNHIELESPEIHAQAAVELPADPVFSGLETVEEPAAEDEAATTP